MEVFRYVLLTLLGFCMVCPSAQAEFSDIGEHNIYRKVIEHVETEGVVSGYPDGTFRPFAEINRAEFVKIVVNAFYGEGAVGVDPTNQVFYDVKGDEWFAPYILFAKNKGIVNGYNDGSFRPEKNINFAEAAKIVVETFDIPVILQEDFGFWWLPYLHALSTVNGSPKPTPDPSLKISRGQMAEIIYRLDTSLGPWKLFSDESVPFWFTYPSTVVDTEASNNTVHITHSVDLEYTDPCAGLFGSRSDTLTDLDLRITYVEGTIEDAMEQTGNTHLLEKHINANGMMDYKKGVATLAYFGDYYGFHFTTQSEGCGEHLYVVTDQKGHTFVVNRKIISAFTALPEEDQEVIKNMSGILLPQQENDIFYDLLHSLTPRALVTEELLEMMNSWQSASAKKRGLLAIV